MRLGMRVLGDIGNMRLEIVEISVKIRKKLRLGYWNNIGDNVENIVRLTI